MAATVAILAGGLATRLGPITETIPKSMMAVAGEPFIAHQLRMLSRRGLRDVVLLCAHLGEQISDFVEDGSRFGCRVQYSFDGPVRRGTGGAIAHALTLLPERFLTVYGDSFCATDYLGILSAFERSSMPALMTVFDNGDRWDKSNVLFQAGPAREAGRILRYSKTEQTPEMHWIDYGVNAFSRAAFEPFAARENFDLAELQGMLVERGQLAGYEVFERFYEIGSHAGLAETRGFLAAIAAEEGGNQR